jgi:hypothetical protein
MGNTSLKEIAKVLAGTRCYDGLDPNAQAIVRAEWRSRADRLRTELNLAADFGATGRFWVEWGADSRVVERG